MKIIIALVLVVGVLLTAADIAFRLQGGYRIGAEQAIAILLAGLVAGVLALLQQKRPG